MLVLPILVIAFLMLRQRVPSQIALIVTLSVSFFWYEFSLFFLAMLNINVFSSVASIIIQVIPIILATVFFWKITKVNSINEKSIKDIFFVREILYYLPSLSILLVLSMSYFRFGWGSMAFAMNGDARNHVWFSRFMIEQKGLNAASAAYYPVLPDGMVALTRSGFKFIEDRAKSPLTFDLISIGFMTATVLILMSLVHIQIGKTLISREHPLKVMSVSIIAFLPLGGLVSKVALSDGFYPALFASLILQLFIFAGWLFIQTNHEKEKSFLLVSLLLLTPLIISTWTILAVIPAFSFILLSKKTKGTIFVMLRAQRGIQLAILLSTLLAYVNLAPLIGKGAASNYVKSPGAITLPPSKLLLGILIGFLVYFAWAAFRDSTDEMRYLAGILFITLSSFLFLASLQDNRNYWNYYPAKFTWIALISVFPFLFSVGIRDFSKNPRFLSIIMIPTLVLLSWSITNSPWVKFDLVNSVKPQSVVYGGWYSPGSVSVNQVLEFGERDVPIVFWDLADPSGDRLANFWLSTYLPARFDNPVLATNQLRDWAYWEIPGKTESLCELLLNSELKWRVYTRNQNLQAQLISICPQGVALSELVVVD